MIELKTAAGIAAMRASGRVTAQALAAVREAAVPGARPVDLDEIAAKVVADAGGRALFLGYRPTPGTGPFPGVTCISVNDAVVHGIPGTRPLADGDLVSVDCGTDLDGWCSDAAISFVVGTADPADRALIGTTTAALEAGIAAARPGARIGDVAAAIGRVGRTAGHGILADHGGHGIGRAMHEPPSVPNEGRPGRGMVLRPGLVLAIEPMFLAGGCDGYRPDPDGWTLRTADGSRAAHVEHTVAVTEDGPVVLTLP
ncbi:methionyl aminopeptidase [Pseudonocardia ammonioxydans]|uniref:Methionine aminopeptidase n=1 Tax=Pseudonocardia ammonioxydans TaxID=260086 RepID=A0A1I4T5V8_PSUAM|nr:type I methionyl aminopeptidase [Pseudonocardia ammonioxydans]SFM71987.1 methionyl aminopeptidase [Pseudonocardia ammonioxydans]